MPPLPLDERIVVIQRPKNLDLCQSSPQNLQQHSSQISGSSNGQVAHHPRLPPSQSHFYSPHAKSLTLECKRRSNRAQKFKAEQPVDSSGGRHTPSHCHSNGTVTLGPRLPSHTHTIDIRVTVDKGGRRGASSNSLGRSESVKGGKGKCASSQFDQGQWERKNGSTGRQVGAEHSRYNQLSTSPGGILQFIPSQAQQLRFRSEREKENASFPSTNDHEYSCVGRRQNSKLGTVHQAHNDHSLPRHHASVPVPHAAILNSTYSSSPPSQPAQVPASFQQFKASHLSRDHRPHILHGLPLSPCSSHPGGFPSPDHTCTIDCTHPFTCGCWRLVRCRFFKEHAASCPGGGGSSTTSVSGAHNTGVKKRSKEMGLRNLGGCLSTTSTSNTSSSNSTVSDCRANLFKPLRCASCSGEAGNLESPAIFRKKLAGGCLPCAPLSSSAPFRAIQSCVTGCNPKASQTGSSSCSYCSSDPIVVTFNPRRGKPPGRSIRAAHPMGMYQTEEDDYSVRTIWPEEVADRMTHAKAAKNYCGRIGPSGSNKADLVPLDCQTLQGYSRAQMADRTGRRRLQQGKMAALDFMGRSSGSGYDEGQNSLKRLLNTEDMGMEDCRDQDGDTAYPHSPSPGSTSPPSPLSFSPPPSAPSTLIKPKPRQRDRDGGHSLPSARSLHLDLNSLNAEQDEENRRSKNKPQFPSYMCKPTLRGMCVDLLARCRWRLSKFLSPCSAPFPAALLFAARVPVWRERDDPRCRECCGQPHPSLSVSGERERRPRPWPAEAPQHWLRGQRHHTLTPVPRQLRPAVQKAAGYGQQQAEPSAVFWGSVWVYRYVYMFKGCWLSGGKTSVTIKAERGKGDVFVTYLWCCSGKK